MISLMLSSRESHACFTECHGFKSYIDSDQQRAIFLSLLDRAAVAREGFPAPRTLLRRFSDDTAFR
jgi:hypothetical protein